MAGMREVSVTTGSCFAILSLFFSSQHRNFSRLKSNLIKQGIRLFTVVVGTH